jgi:hypothetical protein
MFFVFYEANVARFALNAFFSSFRQLPKTSRRSLRPSPKSPRRRAVAPRYRELAHRCAFDRSVAGGASPMTRGFGIASGVLTFRVIAF